MTLSVVLTSVQFPVLRTHGCTPAALFVPVTISLGQKAINAVHDLASGASIARGVRLSLCFFVVSHHLLLYLKVISALKYINNS